MEMADGILTVGSPYRHPIPPGDPVTTVMVMETLAPAYIQLGQGPPSLSDGDVVMVYGPERCGWDFDF